MANRRPKLGTRSAVLAELEKAYAALVNGTDWDLSDRDFLQMQLRMLETAAKMADDSDVLGQLQALKERVDADSRPQGAPPARGNLRSVR